jgi:SAM-dependent methyltransferase
MDFTHFDKRNYPVVSARSGYGEWAEHYDSTVAEGLDRPLLGALGAVQWPSVRSAVDLACGTGRTGVWLQQQGVRAIDGVDLTPEMLERARAREIYRTLKVADIAATGLPSSGYDLCTMVLADEHLADLKPVYREAARLLGPGGSFVVVGYHPYFLMNGIPTHYHRDGRDRSGPVRRSEQRNAVDLHVERRGPRRHVQENARRRVLRKIAVVDLVEGCKMRRVGRAVDVAFDDARQRRARGLQTKLHLLQHQLGLPRHRHAPDLAGLRIKRRQS